MTEQTRWIVAGVGEGLFLLGVAWFGAATEALRDESAAKKKPYSFARVQLLFWTAVVIGSWLLVWALNGTFWDFNGTCLTLLGISGATTIAARVIDSRDISDPEIRRHQDDTKGSKGFFRDILSDDKGPSIHRYQSLVFNVAFAFWFVLETVESSSGGVFPEFAPTTLALLTFSSGTYLAIKATENQAAPGGGEGNATVEREAPAAPAVSQTLPKAPPEEEAA